MAWSGLSERGRLFDDNVVVNKVFVVNGTAMTGAVVTVIALDAWIGIIKEFFGSSLIHFGPIDAVFEQVWSRITLLIDGIPGDFVGGDG